MSDWLQIDLVFHLLVQLGEKVPSRPGEGRNHLEEGSPALGVEGNLVLYQVAEV